MCQIWSRVCICIAWSRVACDRLCWMRRVIGDDLLHCPTSSVESSPRRCTLCRNDSVRTEAVDLFIHYTALPSAGVKGNWSRDGVRTTMTHRVRLMHKKVLSTLTGLWHIQITRRRVRTTSTGGCGDTYKKHTSEQQANKQSKRHKSCRQQAKRTHKQGEQTSKETHLLKDYLNKSKQEGSRSHSSSRSSAISSIRRGVKTRGDHETRTCELCTHVGATVAKITKNTEPTLVPTLFLNMGGKGMLLVMIGS